MSGSYPFFFFFPFPSQLLACPQLFNWGELLANSFVRRGRGGEGIWTTQRLLIFFGLFADNICIIGCPISKNPNFYGRDGRKGAEGAGLARYQEIILLLQGFLFSSLACLLGYRALAWLWVSIEGRLKWERKEEEGRETCTIVVLSMVVGIYML